MSTSGIIAKNLSSSLKERLKRCGRYHSSPIGPPTKKRIYYPASTPPQTPVSKTETRAKGDNLSSPANLAAGFTDEALETGFGPNSTPLKSEKILKLDSGTPDYLKKYTPKSPAVDSCLSLAPGTPDITSNGMSTTVSIISSPTVSDAIKICNKTQSQGIRQVGLCPKTPDTIQFVNKNIAKDVSGHHLSEPRYERTPIRSRNVSSCKPSRLHFSGRSDTEGSIAACKQTCTEQVGFQITPAEESKCSAYESVSTDDAETLQEKYERLKNILTEKEEELRKLNMVKMYRTKNDLDSLSELVSKWRMTSQQALIDLHNKLQDPKPSLAQLIDHLQIEHSLVHFNPEDETFNFAQSKD